MQRNFRATAKPPEPKDDLLIMKKTREMIAYGHDCLYNKQFPRNQRIGNAIGAQIEKSMYEIRAFGLPLGVDPCEIDPREMLFDKGMPIGNLTSQMFANIYMNELDQYLKHELHLKYVIRYTDDCIILHDSKEELWQVLEKVETFLLENLKLNLNNKTVIRPTTCNIDFVGYMINKDEIRLRSATVKRMRSRIKYIVKAYERGEMTLQEVNATMQSYFGLIKHCTNEGLRENIINGFVLHCTDAARAKARESR